MTKLQNIKRALIMSVISLFLCVTLLIGSTFAWFTDTVTTGVSNITIGTFEVQIVDDDGDNTIEFDYGTGNTYWEPGKSVTTETFQVKNNGNLDMYYTIQLVIKGNVDVANCFNFALCYQKGDAPSANDEAVPITDIELKQKALSNPMYIRATMKSDVTQYMGKELTGISVVVYAKQTVTGADYDKTATN